MSKPSKAGSPISKPHGLLLAIVLLSACAHSTSQNPSGVASEPASTSAIAVDGVRSQRVKEAGERFLKLVGEIKSRKDISVAKVEEAMRIRLLGDAKGMSFGAIEDLGGGWSYRVSVIVGSSSLEPGFSLDFSKSGDRFADMSSICSPNFAYYNVALKKLGYRDVVITDEIGQLLDFRYYKEDIVISIVPEAKYFESEHKILPTCVRSIGTLN